MGYVDRLVQVGQDAEREIAALEYQNEQLRKRIQELEGGNGRTDIRQLHDQLTAKAEGYARGITGGQGGQITVVDSVDELRRYASDSTTRIIVFDRSVDGDRWTIRGKDEEIKPRSNKTIWAVDKNGKPVDIEIRADWRGDGAAIRCNKTNVIIAGLRGSFGTRGRDNDAPDWCAVTSTCEKAWIYGVNFVGSGTDREDGVVDCMGIATVQSLACRKAEKPHLCKGNGGLSLIDNTYTDCGGRFPRVGDNAVAEVLHCQIKNWDWRYACLVSENGRLSVNNTTFLPSDSRKWAIETRDRGSWSGSGNEFNGARY